MENARLFLKENCPFSRKVTTFIEGAGLKSHVSYVFIDHDAEMSRELQRISGKSQVPCLEVDGMVLLESEAIIDWFNQEFAAEVAS